MADLLFHDPVEDSARGSHDDLLWTQDTVLNYNETKYKLTVVWIKLYYLDDHDHSIWQEKCAPTLLKMEAGIG